MAGTETPARSDPGYVEHSFDESTETARAAEPEADFAPLADAEPAAGASDAAVDPFQADSLEAQQAFEAAQNAEQEGNEEGAIQEYIRAAKIAEVAREWYLAAVACQRVGDFLLKPPPPMDLERGFRMYRRAVAAYEQCGLFAEARELAYRQMCWKLRTGGVLGLRRSHRLELLLHWAVAGFGFRPMRVVGMGALLILLYAVVYWAADGVVKTGWHGHITFWKALYFSGVTFATVGYGDFIPAPHVRMVAMSEGFLGALTMGFFVAVLANRLSKS